VANNQEDDPRVYLAAERTLLAWIRTGVALMGFGFVVARFGLFLREITPGAGPLPESGWSLHVGVGLIGIGVLACIVSAIQHSRYVRALDAGEFRQHFGSTFAFLVVGLLALLGVGMVAWLIGL
jgi:putative membrane protein